MPRGPVKTYRETQKVLLNSLLHQSKTLRTNPASAPEVSTALFGLIPQVEALKAASMSMASSTRYNAYVTSKPYGYFSHEIPALCDSIIACLFHWGDILVYGDGQRTDGIVVIGIEGVAGRLSV
ncbi:hypothetical protein PENANT_c013G08185 [Penicillium antarcticum]|uniref:Uncharacterized protein n=1 Tax=Penicillium antarcticum TaxID=416450 RepID=A0A1V6Q6C8_9EURO|nr:hypothetical protein PENANT_c013G08185 [Penicillium antarcticum]